jgi:signal transduction histidine kinase
MTQPGYVLLGLAALFGVVSAAATFALLRFSAAARLARGHASPRATEAAMLSSALQDAVQRLKERADVTTARADASEQLSSLIVEHLTAGLLVVNASGRVDILNPAGRRILGVAGDPAGLDVRRVLAGAVPLIPVIDDCLATGDPQARRPLELEIEGRIAHLGVTVSPLGGPGDPRGVVCLFSDLTAIVALEEEVRLKDTLAQLGELTAGLAHEFRNGLATIKGYGRLMDPSRLPEPYVPYLQAIRDETDSLGRIVTNFLDFARPDRVAFVEVSLDALVTEAVDDVRRDLPHAEIRAAGTFAPILGDEVLLRQVLINLIRNAVQACDSAGVAARVSIEGQVDADGTCRVRVDDAGPGVDPKLRDRVFRPFFTNRAGGTGLGLAIVQKVVVTHSGRIAIGASPLGGARFELAFPQRLSAAA